MSCDFYDVVDSTISVCIYVLSVELDVSSPAVGDCSTKLC